MLVEKQKTLSLLEVLNPLGNIQLILSELKFKNFYLPIDYFNNLYVPKRNIFLYNISNIL